MFLSYDKYAMNLRSSIFHYTDMTFSRVNQKKKKDFGKFDLYIYFYNNIALYTVTVLYCRN